jgi:hypothetical protein
MTVWQEKGLELLPSLRETIVAAENPMALWIELYIELERAYEANQPDEDLIANIFRYAHWSEFEAGDDEDVQTAASLAFYENLPTHARVSADLPNRITKAEFLKLKDLFRYLLEPDEYQAFEQEFLAAAERKTN